MWHTALATCHLLSWWNLVVGCRRSKLPPRKNKVVCHSIRVLIMQRKDKREIKLEINEFIKLLDIFILNIRLSRENDIRRITATYIEKSQKIQNSDINSRKNLVTELKEALK
jgi:hypothetical protein